MAFHHPIFRSLALLGGEWRQWRRARHTKRVIADLPRHIRKDIGWPDDLPHQRHQRSDWTL